MKIAYTFIASEELLIYILLLHTAMHLKIQIWINNKSINGALSVNYHLVSKENLIKIHSRIVFKAKMICLIFIKVALPLLMLINTFPCYFVTLFLWLARNQNVAKGKSLVGLYSYITLNMRSSKRTLEFLHITCLKYKVAFNLKQTSISNKGICWQFFRVPCILEYVICP